MSIKKSFSDNCFSLACIIFYPAGCIWWIFGHRDGNNRRFLVLCIFGCITAMVAFNYGISGCLVNKDPDSFTVLLISAILYGIGLMAFVIMSWHKRKTIDRPD